MAGIPHALVLTAGLGTRLRPLTSVRAKPAIPVAGDPLVRRIIRSLVSHGVSDIVLNLHHLPETLAAVVGDGRDLGARVRYSWEQPQVLGSAGGPRLALPIVGAETFFVVNGDTLTDVDLGALGAAHLATGADATLALVPNTEPHRYGGVQLDAAGGVTRFLPRGPSAEGSYHYVGVQAVRAELFRPLTPGVPASSIGGLYDAVIASRPGAIRGFACDARFWDIGTVADYWRTSRAFAADPGAHPRGRRGRVDASADVNGSILWDDVEVGAGARLEECIVTDGARVPAGAVHRRSILMHGEGGTVALPFEGAHG